MHSLSPLVALVTLGAATLMFAGTSGAEVSEVGGGAFGYSAKVSLFGGPAASRGPAPSVSLPASGSASPVTASDPSGAVTFGPATIFESGALRVSTQGTTGADGSVESSATVTGKADGPGPVLYGEVASTCTAKESGVTASATIASGKVETKYDADTQLAVSTQPVPANPAPNTEISGTVDHVGDTFRVVFNEQTKNADGSITVNGAHLYLLGPSAVGDLIIAQSRCSTSAAAASPSASGSPAQRSGQPKATTTTRPAAQPGSGSTGGGDPMANTGADVLPTVIMASAFLIAGAILLVDGRGRPARTKHVQHGRP